ncbi:MAG: hypothetical protein HY913_00035 [Desulfomonile tiedjei]|nr:hypothetical protein [Desulfomonile tiedjei]
MKHPKERLVSLIPPAVPLWGVYYAEDEPDHLLILPVLGLAKVEMPERDDPGNREIHPLVFDRVFGNDNAWWEDVDTLGFLLQEELPKAAEIFAADVARKRDTRA